MGVNSVVNEAASEEAIDVALKALLDVKRSLMHQRRFGADTMGAWRNAACDAEGSAEEALATIRGLRSRPQESREASCAGSA